LVVPLLYRTFMARTSAAPSASLSSTDNRHASRRDSVLPPGD
jgi:hypothetical protein